MTTLYDQDKPADVLKFKGPINLDSSFGTRAVAKRASSVMTLYFYKDGTGSIEWTVPHYDLCEYIGLTFDYDHKGKRTLAEYDGVFAIPDEAMTLLERNGVDCEEMRKAMSS